MWLLLALTFALSGSSLLAQAPVSPAPDDQAAIAAFRKGASAPDAPGVVAPKVRELPRVQYTGDAMRRKVQGVVDLEVVVGPTGSVERVRLVKGLDPDLDQQAISAASSSKYTPGTLDSKPAMVYVAVSFSFKIY